MKICVRKRVARPYRHCGTYGCGGSDGVFGRLDGEPAVEIKGCYVFGGMKVNGENVKRSDNFNFLFAAYGKMYTDSEYTLPFEIKINSL